MEATLKQLVDQLKEVRQELQQLSDEEAEIKSEIIHLVGHNRAGQGTYERDGVKVMIKTGENVRLDKSLLNVKWNESMPINRSYDYTLRFRDFDAVMKSGTPEQKRELAEIVTTCPAKPVVKIVE